MIRDVPSDVQQTIARLRRAEPELVEAATVAPAETFEHPRTRAEGGGLRALEVLKAQLSEPGRSQRLRTEETLGEGGMGIVRLATQMTMGRKVAVKGLQSNYRHEDAIVKLLQEAWITGTLEHPNVAPVYDIDLDRDGLPEIIMKRIEGSHWGQLMFDAETVSKRFGQRLGEWNLRVLIDVANAVRFAHDRGIVHRDLKPENVMIGEFGEVYVLDWGLAVALRDDGTGRLPLARDATQFSGTPSYMAPEMLTGGDPPIEERTDVYLLGAILYEVLNGRPPHRGEFDEMVASAYRSDPSFKDAAPQELRDICRKAMARHAGDRYTTAEAFQAAVQGYLEHSGARRLASGARQRLTKLVALVEERGDDVVARRRIYDLYGECRFGFQQSLDTWSDNDAARRGLDQLAAIMIDYELGRGDARAAQLIVEGQSNVPDDVAARVANASHEADKEQERIEALARRAEELAPDSEGALSRTLRAGTIGAAWTLFPLGQALVGGDVGESHMVPMLTLLGFLGIIGAAAVVMRTRSLRALDRRILGSAALAMVSTLLLHLVGIAMGITANKVVQAWPFAWFIVSATLVINIDWRLLPMTLGFIVLLFAGVKWPHYYFYAMSLQNLLVTFNLVYAWRPRSGAPSAS